MSGYEETCFSIISLAGTARSLYIEAISEAEEGNFEQANQLVLEGKETFNDCHKAHFDMIQKEANGEKNQIGLLLIHAEDQLMSAEAFGILAEKFIALYQKVNEK